MLLKTRQLWNLKLQQNACQFTKRYLHEYLVIAKGAKEIPDLGLKATFAGRTSPEETSSPKTVFACRAESVKKVSEAIQQNGTWDISNVTILPLETVHTSQLESSQKFPASS